MKIEVRCCCDGALKGSIKMTEPPLGSPAILGGLRFDYQNLKCGDHQLPALKSRHYSEADLRSIRDFVPATFEDRVRDAEFLLVLS